MPDGYLREWKPKSMLMNSIGYIAGFCLTFASAVVIHLFVIDRALLAEGPPMLSGYFLAVSVLLLVSAWMLVKGLYVGGQQRAPTPLNRGGWGAAAVWGYVAVQPDLPAGLPTFRFTWKDGLVVGFVAVAIGMTLLLAMRPASYHRLADEDGIVENASALLAGLSAVLFGMVAVRLRQRRPGVTVWHVGGALMLALAAFLLAMEEVSWFQRVVGIETPAAFEENMQREFNLHNFATSETENIYYFGIFLLFGIGAFGGYYRRELLRPSWLRFFTPSLLLLYCSAPAAAYTYDMWNVPFIQFIVYASVLMILYDLPRARHAGEEKVAWLVLVSVGGVQGLYLWLGDTQRQAWDVTEYRELLLPACLVVYALELFIRTVGPDPVAAGNPVKDRFPEAAWPPA